MRALDFVSQSQLRTDLPPFRSGDRIRVHLKVRESDGKDRIQVFEGDVIAMHHNGISSTFTVRKVSFGVGVERVFPKHSPTIEKIELKKRGKVRRAKLYYLRGLKGKAARIKDLDQDKG